MAQPKSPMAEGYIQDECLGFITKYLQKFDIVKRHIWVVDEEKRDAGEVLEGLGTKFHMSPILDDLAHQYVLTNTTIMTPWTG